MAEEYIERPEGAPAATTGRLVDLFPVKDASNRHILNGVIYEVDFCDQVTKTVDTDGYEDCIRTAEKEFSEGLLFVRSVPIGAQYEAIKCRPGFGTGGPDDYEARARRRLDGKATTFLEEAVETYVLDGSNATAVTAGANLEESIAALVSQNIENPVLHISTENAVLLGGKLDNILLAGIAVVISPVYSDDTAFLTGPVHVWGGEYAVNSTVTDVALNYVLAIAEREYIMAIEPGAGCKPYKVTLS